MTTAQIISSLLTLLGSGVLVTILNNYNNRKLIKAQADEKEATAADIHTKIYSQLIKDLTHQINNLKEINKELSESKEKLIRELRELEAEVESLRKQVGKLTARLRKYEDG